MSRLIVTRGLPASGKTSRMRAWVAEATQHRCRVNRDDLRAMMFGGWTGLAAHEEMVSRVQRATVRVQLAKGVDVGVDDTNLNPAHLAVWEQIARDMRVVLEVWDLTDVPLQVCIDRDAARGARGGRRVGEQVIRGMYGRWLAGAVQVTAGPA